MSSLRSVFAQLQRKSRLVGGSSRNFCSSTRRNNASNGGTGGAVQDRGPMVTLCKFRFSSSVVLGYFVGAGFEIMELSKTLRRLYEEEYLLEKLEIELESNMYKEILYGPQNK